jgi:ligand-binding sensor domain-containing protein
MNAIAINILLLLFFSCILFSQQKSSFPDPQFEYLTLNDGLPENTVLSILQDKFGYMWLGTHSGLVRYDGYTMKVYYHDENDSLSLNNNRTLMIYEDRSGTLWMGSYSGLDRFDRKTETFTQYIYDDFISGMFEDSTNQLWALGRIGLYHFDSQNNRFNFHQFQDTAYVDDVYKYFLSLKKNGKIIASISNVGDNADLTKSFLLKQKTPVYIVIVGESNVDYGWLENDRGKIIYSYDLKSTYYAGEERTTGFR